MADDQSTRRHWAVKHGLSATPEYRAWIAMRSRCRNSNSQRFDRYGARGIRVCDRWASFDVFYVDMGQRPGPGYSIDRIDNNGDYEPGNCRWATRDEQVRNRSDNVYLEHDGERHTIAEWSRKTGVGAKTIEYRLRAGWSIQDVLTREVEYREGWTQGPPIRSKSWKRAKPCGPSRICRSVGTVLDNYEEIQRRLSQGEKQRDVAASFGMNQPALSVARAKIAKFRDVYCRLLLEQGRQEVYEAIERERRFKERRDEIL